MNKANEFFFLTSVSDRVVCDFRRHDNTMVLEFSDKDDELRNQVLEIVVSPAESSSGTRGYSLDYSLHSWETVRKCIQNGKSIPMPASAVWGSIVALVNDVFPVDISRRKA